jgi:hypothetical protein
MAKRENLFLLPSEVDQTDFGKPFVLFGDVSRGQNSPTTFDRHENTGAKNSAAPAFAPANQTNPKI